jgi:hypothetical protein
VPTDKDIRGDPETISVSFTWNNSEVRALLRTYWRRRLIWLSLPLIAVLILFMLQIGFDIVGFIAGLAVMVPVLLVIMLLWDHGVLRKPRYPIRCDFASSEVLVSSKGTSTRHHWSEYSGIRSSKRFAILPKIAGDATNVPRRAFSDEASVDRLMEMGRRLTSPVVKPSSSERDPG